MELDLPTSVSHPPLQEYACAAKWDIYCQKYICKYKNLAQIGEITFYVKKLKKEFENLAFGNSELVES